MSKESNSILTIIGVIFSCLAMAGLMLMMIQRKCGCFCSKARQKNTCEEKQDDQSPNLKKLESKMKFLENEILRIEGKFIQKFEKQLGDLSNEIKASDNKMANLLKWELEIEEKIKGQEAKFFHEISELNEKIEKKLDEK